MSNEAGGWGDNNMCCIVNWFDSKNIWVFHHCTLGSDASGRHTEEQMFAATRFKLDLPLLY